MLTPPSLIPYTKYTMPKNILDKAFSPPPSSPHVLNGNCCDYDKHVLHLPSTGKPTLIVIINYSLCRHPDSGNAYRFSEKDFGCKVCRQILQLSLLRALNLPTTAPSGGTFDTQSKLPPDHFVHDTYVALDDADDFGADILVHVVGDGDAGEAVADEGDGDVHALEQTNGIDAAEHNPSTPLRSRNPIRAQGRGW